jgi:hypothetical protein
MIFKGMLLVLALAVSPTVSIWVTVALFVGLAGFVAVKTKGAVTRSEMHHEVQELETKIDAEFDKVEQRFESERAIARDANSKIYNRINDTAQGVTRVESQMGAMQEMLGKLVDKNLKG